MTKPNNTLSLKAAMLAGAASFVLATAQAQTAQTKTIEFDIDAQDLGSALTEFGIQSGKEVYFVEADVTGKVTSGVEGQYSSDRAITLILADAEIPFTIDDNGTVLVGNEYVRTASLGEETTPAPFRVAQLDQEEAVRGVDLDEAEADDEVRREDVIVVTGTNIRGVEAIGAAALTFDRGEIEDAGFSSIEELFESLPQNLDELSSDGAFATGASDIGSANRGVGAASISLRGLGPGSTLTLLNGKRRPGNLRGRAVDISAIPLSMIERVEVVTGGRSAVFGSDAVAGVVNIVTRTAFDGAETQVYYGGASAGGERLNASQTFGREFDRGGFVVGYDYSKEWALEVNDTGAASGPTSAGRTPIFFNLQLPSEQHAGLFAGHFNLSDSVRLYADAHVSFDDTDSNVIEEIAFGFAQTGGKVNTKSNQYSFTAGVDFDIGNGWAADVSALHGVVDNEQPFANLVAFPPDMISFDSPFTNQDDDKAKLTSFSAIADGPLGSIGGINVSTAIGMEYRQESYTRSRLNFSANTSTQEEDGDRDIWSVFGELYLPLIDQDNQKLDLSLAARYDNYSDFGDTFNPQIGLDWQPANGVSLRGSYSTAFRSPDLFTLADGSNIIAANIIDPMAPIAGGSTPTFGVFGGNPDLQPEEADTWTVGADWEPWSGGSMSISYFNITYDNRIDIAEASLAAVLGNEDQLSSLINRSPTSGQVAQLISGSDLASFRNFTGVAFDPLTDDPLSIFPGLVLYDGRSNNIATEEVDGIDFQVSTDIETESGDWSLGLNGTYYLDFTRNVTETAPSLDQLNSPGKLVDLRLRGHVGWSRAAWSINGYINYVNDYDDTFAATPTEIDSWITADLTVGFDTSKLAGESALNGVKATLGINNLFDEDPPLFRNNTFGITYDTANANALGRYVSLRLVKSW